MRAKTEKHAGKHPRHRGTSGYANEPANQDRAHGLPQDKVHDFAAVSAERHADADRVHEIGVRMALGADGGEIMNLVLRQAMRPVLVGGLVGVAGCAAVSWVFSSMLFGLSAHDPMAFVIVPLLLLILALVASYLPARRATRVDPMVALRYE